MLALNSSPGRPPKGVTISKTGYGQSHLLPKWYPEALLPFPVHHGENLPPPTTANPQIHETSSNMLMDKTDLDLELLCVNPFDVMGAQISPLKDSPKVEQKVYKNWDEFGIVLSPQIENSPPSGATSLEMEKFSDLTEYLPKIIMDKKEKTYDDNADELNTPVINKEAFNFTPYISNNNLQKGNENVNLNILEENSSLFKFGLENFAPNINNNNNNQLIDVQVSAAGQTNPNTSAEELLYVNNKSSDYELKDQYQETENVDSPLSIISEQSSFYFNNSALSNNNNSVNQETTNISSPSSIIMDGNGLITPEDSCCSSVEEKVPITQLRRDPTMLKLNINLFSNSANFDINTPDVIDAVMNYEDETGLNTDFTMIGEEMDEEEFLKLLNNQPTVKEETKADISSYEDAISSLPPEEKKENIISTINLRTSRKRKTYDDDDEYIPPKELREIVGSDSESEEEAIKKPRPRGRPPKRSVSISSDCSKESGDASKYRELRDKNNEASRRSRQKRKQKELEMEKEAEILSKKNIQLKAQVSELEKTVKNFRDNLFSILAKK